MRVPLESFGVVDSERPLPPASWVGLREQVRGHGKVVAWLKLRGQSSAGDGRPPLRHDAAVGGAEPCAGEGHPAWRQWSFCAAPPFQGPEGADRVVGDRRGGDTVHGCLEDTGGEPRRVSGPHKESGLRWHRRRYRVEGLVGIGRRPGSLE